jgi:lysophospholipase L1-like esterase
MIVVACLGDSITEGSPGWQHDTGGDPQSTWMHWAGLADPRLELRNFGIHGETTAEIAARLEEAIEGADVIVVQGGINDVYHGLDVERAAENLGGMVCRGKQLGLRVVLANVLPWNNGRPGDQEKIRRLNLLIEQIGRAEDVPVLDFNGTLADPADPSRMRAEWTVEGNHPNVAGHRRLGELAFRLP